MTTESTQPPQEAAQAPAALPGQTQGHRRRRRRRKTKSNLAAAQGTNGQTLQPQSSPPPAAANPPQQSFQPAAPAAFQGPRPSQQQGIGGSGSGRKKKKKRRGGGGGSGEPNDGQLAFLPREGGSSYGNGNGNGNGGGGYGKKRKQQRGPRQFVGPMDHSYRAVNGNVADGPPSTIPFGGNIHNGSYHNEAPRTQAPAIAADAKTRIYLFIEDLFFLAKIQEASRKLGVKVEFVKLDDKEKIALIMEQAAVDHPTLLVFDLNNGKPLTLIPKFKTKMKRAAAIIGFLSHIQGDLKAKATEAGCDTVMPRSAFSQSLPNLLRRYGIDDDEDHHQQPN